MSEAEETAQPAARRRRMWVVFAVLSVVFLAPFLIAWILYLNINHFHFGTNQHGEFIKPAREISISPLPLPLTGKSLAVDYFNNHFTLVYISAATCNADCEEALYLTRQVRYAMGEKIEAIQRLYLVEGTPQNPGKLQREQADATVADVSGPGGASFIRQFSLNGKSAPHVGRYIYLVDPRGFYIMRYSIAGKPEGLLKDLQHLLGQGGGM
ncbi:MAG: hypothetical protein KGL13_07005 [Gammaproteobacteria bacterium]|nr:hypothetical protein [Gammaproteobacteria bacterium]MDE2346199.1 hypothetical protein [Gammaproteobacteria bacterium]